MARRKKGSRREFANQEWSWFRQQLRKVASRDMYGHVFHNSDREVGGVLVGSKEGDLPIIHASIRAMKADEQRATLTFTQDSWEYVHRVIDEHFQDCEIVGWYHSHPGFGIFLSEHDKFIHRNFFNDPSQIAYVIDPVAGTEGVFTWQDGEIQPLFEQQTPDSWGNPARRLLEQDDWTQKVKMAKIPLIAALLVGLVGGILLWGTLFSGDSSNSSSGNQIPSATGASGATGSSWVTGPSGEIDGQSPDASAEGAAGSESDDSSVTPTAEPTDGPRPES